MLKIKNTFLKMFVKITFRESKPFQSEFRIIRLNYIKICLKHEFTEKYLKLNYDRHFELIAPYIRLK